MHVDVIFLLILFSLSLAISLAIFYNYIPHTDKKDCNNFLKTLEECKIQCRNHTNILLLESCLEYKPGRYNIICIEDKKCIVIPMR